MEGQAERQPLSTNDAAAAIESLLGDNGDFLETVAEEPEAPEESDAEESEEVEATQDSDEDEAESEPEQAALETIDDVAQALGVDTKDLLANLKMRIKVNGEERLVSLEEAQKGHQMEADYRRKTMELAEQRKAVEQDYVQRQALYHQQAAEAASVLNVAEQALLAELNTPNMVELRQTNPAEWNARHFEAQQKLAAIQQTRQQAAAQWQQQQSYASQEQQRQFQAYLANEQEALSNAVTERGESLTAERKAALADFLVTRYGFTQQDVGQVYNHRLVLMALDAMKGMEGAKKAEAVKEKVKTLPLMQKPGTKANKVSVQAKQLQALRGRLKQTGKIGDAAAMIERLI